LKHEQLNYEKFKTQEAAKLSVIDYLAFSIAIDIGLSISDRIRAGILLKRCLNRCPVVVDHYKVKWIYDDAKVRLGKQFTKLS